jgi:SAM-dependent methyltransferase
MAANTGMWDQRYSGESYAFGTEPNTFLITMAGRLPPGRVLCLGEGEGRNAVWLAAQRWNVTAVDASSVGLEKARRLAAERGVTVTTVHSDLERYDIGSGQWDGIVSIFCHLPPSVRADVHNRCKQGLRPGGVMILEAYTPRQLEYGTGGPPTADLMMDGPLLRNELTGLEFLHLQESVREVREGVYHTGPGAVVQLVARRPR